MQITEISQFNGMTEDSKSLAEQGYRTFIPDNPNRLAVPGLLSIDEVLIDGILLPEYIDHEVPLDSTHTRFGIARVKLYKLDQGFLFRGNGSNDGKWQPETSRIYIKGKWADETNAPTAVTTASVATPSVASEPSKINASKLDIDKDK